MPYAVTVPLDAAAAAAIQRMWRALAERANADDAIRLGYVPHLTLAVLTKEAPASEVQDAVSRATEVWASFSMLLTGFGIFPGTPSVVWAAPTVTIDLLTRHASLCAGLVSFDIHPHYRPDHWVPHVTLTQEAPSAARAVEVVASTWDQPVAARLETIELVRFYPVSVLWSQRLKPGV